MKINFIPTKKFEASAKVLNKRYASFKSDFKKILDDIRKNPEIGSPLGKKVRKIRVKIESKGKGESGGARLITYEALTLETGKDIVLLYIYDKSDMATLSEKFIKKLLKEYKEQ